MLRQLAASSARLVQQANHPMPYTTFIHDMALRKTMLGAHRQAWVWQDEWFGLTMDDIRDIERKTAEELKKKMRGEEEDPEVKP